MTGRGWKIIPNATDVPFDNSTNGYTADNVQDAIEEGVSLALQTPIFPLSLLWNGTVSNGKWYGYSNLLPGDETPIVIPSKSEFIGFTWSNGNTGADFTLHFKKNSTGAADFLSDSRTNTQFYNYFLVTPELFLAGETIFIQHEDDGTNANDVGFILIFRTIPI